MLYPIHDDYKNYLVEIEQDRYQGKYSGHRYTAWRGIRPKYIDDVEDVCQAFWEELPEPLIFGGGSTPKEAFADLIRKLLGQGIGIYDPEFVLLSPLRVIVILSIFDESDIIPVNTDKFKHWIEGAFPAKTS